LIRFLYIVNPTSGKGRGKKVIPTIEEFCKSSKIDYTILETKQRAHAIELTQNNSHKFDAIVAVGGDGTVNEVVNGLMVDGASPTHFGVLPVGSGNDFVKNIKLPKNIKDILSVIHNEELREITHSDLGEITFSDGNNTDVHKHYFINGLGIGFDAYVAYINQSNKFLSGLPSYIFAVFKALINYKMINVQIKNQDIDISGNKLMITIGNGISHGGGFYLTPKAKVNDGLFDLSVFDSITRRRLLTALPLALLNKIDKVPEAVMSRFESIQINLRDPYYIHCDGEIISDKLLSANIKLKERVLKIISQKN